MTIKQMYYDLADDLRFQLYDKNKETIQYIFKGNIERVGVHHRHRYGEYRKHTLINCKQFANYKTK